jgi:cation:H+ antiporter
MALEILLLVVGFVLLIKSADWLVTGASALARKFNISDLAIGLTIVAFGTSAPELVVNVFAAVQEHPEIVFGNVIGSNNFNIYIILGVAGLIAPLAVQSSTVWKEIPLSLFAAVLLFVLVNDFQSDGAPLLSRVDGVILLLMFAYFMFYVYRQLRTDPVRSDERHRQFSNGRMALLIFAGLGGLVAGGRLVVSNAIEMAAALGVSEKIIGLTIVAAGTSLPELATSVVAAFRKNNDIAVGNVIGSNIFNIFFILAISVLIRPAAYNPVFNTDFYLLFFGSLVLFVAMFTGKRKKLDRWEAALFLVLYIGYTAYLIAQES